jgi:hypothetical protein
MQIMICLSMVEAQHEALSSWQCENKTTAEYNRHCA